MCAFAFGGHEAGVPLRSLGLGSTRLLIAGIQRQAAAHASIIALLRADKRRHDT